MGLRFRVKGWSWRDSGRGRGRRMGRIAPLARQRRAPQKPARPLAPLHASPGGARLYAGGPAVQDAHDLPGLAVEVPVEIERQEVAKHVAADLAESGLGGGRGVEVGGGVGRG